MIVVMFAEKQSTADICKETGARQKWVDNKRDLYQKGKTTDIKDYEHKKLSADEYVMLAGRLEK
eukprot:CAMPEP_0117427008 /NCGR_PEP_ID=MMETSP0758-20121206/6963_1 /TAXON_ID=63605 /ORGANISM="Percolomonas cosmopolitus, Strain AE-1 (ATCC 50343)" /LENGTH=63 /DNA_ID=CAMNT_0005212429 /DNA_START=664 /DNA_END=852 /DNA_ORIENTATION=-